MRGGSPQGPNRGPQPEGLYSGEPMGQKTREMTIGICIIIVGVIFLIMSGSIPATPALFPRLMSVVAILLGVLQSAAALTLPADQAEQDQSSRSMVVFLEILGVIVLHIILLSTAGFVVANLVLTLGLFLVLGYRRWAPMSVAAVGVTMLLYLVFRIALGIPLPTGILL